VFKKNGTLFSVRLKVNRVMSKITKYKFIVNGKLKKCAFGWFDGVDVINHTIC
jgi:hypothetical protein